jgi:dTDP-4-dehydrorhamnose reductase
MLYANNLVKLLQKDATGTFHIVSKGEASHFDFAVQALKVAGYNPGEILVPKTDAKTAEHVVLESLMLEMQGIELPTWQEDLEEYMRTAGLAV